MENGQPKITIIANPYIKSPKIMELYMCIETGLERKKIISLCFFSLFQVNIRVMRVKLVTIFCSSYLAIKCGSG